MDQYEKLISSDIKSNGSNTSLNYSIDENLVVGESSSSSSTKSNQSSSDEILQRQDLIEDDNQPILVFEQQNSPKASGNAESRVKKVRRHIIGAICVLVVVFLWVFSSILTQIIFTEQSFDKPFFLTYFNTSIFSFYLFGFVIKWKQWTAIPIKNNKDRVILPSSSVSLINNNIDDSNESSSPQLRDSDFSIRPQEQQQNQPHSLMSIIKISAILCPIWFAANYTYNISLDITSVSSNTILSSLSGIFSLFISVGLKVDKFSIEKLFSVIISLSGIVLVSYSDISSNNGNDTVIGDILAVVGAALYGLYCTMIKKLVVSEDLLPMPMMFGFVGFINFLFLWPGFFIINAIGFETFELPSLKVFWFLLFNGIFGSFLSDLIESYSVVLTSPVINTIGLSLSIPLAMISDFVRKKSTFGWMYIAGSCLVVLGFLLANLASSLFEEKLKRAEKRILKIFKSE